MPVLMKGSCRCGAVRFEAESHTPVPYQLCYCSICRKQQGGGGYAINLAADARTLKVEGEEHLGLYRAETQAAALQSVVRRAPFLPRVRRGPLALRSELAGAGAPLRQCDRQRPAGRAAARAPHAEIQGQLGRAGHSRGGRRLRLLL